MRNCFVDAIHEQDQRIAGKREILAIPDSLPSQTSAAEALP
jgi:hypothetical protein